MRVFALIIVLAVLPFLGACDRTEPDSTKSESAQEKPVTGEEPAAEGEPAARKEPLPKVDVPTHGVKFDPPVEPEQLTPGAWFCDMGTAHYAQMERREKCPVCGMKLVQYKPDGYVEPDDDEEPLPNAGHDPENLPDDQHPDEPHPDERHPDER